MGIAEIQQVAVSLFAEKGYAATGIRELGRAAGINSATLYHIGGVQAGDPHQHHAIMP